MFSLIKKALLSSITCRPSFIAGLFFFMLFFKTCNCQELPSFSSVLSLLYNKPISLIDLPDSSRLDLNYHYDPLLSEKPRHSDDSCNSILYSQTANVKLNLFRPNLRFFVSGAFSDLDLKIADDYQKYKVETFISDYTASSGIMYKYHLFSCGIGIGRIFSKDIDLEHWSEIADNLNKYIAEGPWQFSGAAGFSLPAAKISLSLFSGPVHSSVSTFSKMDNSSFRNFPVTLIKRSAQIGITISKNSLLSTSAAGVSFFHNTDLITKENLMPQNIEFTSYSIETSGKMHTLMSDSLFWKVNALIAGGLLRSFNFERNSFTFFRADSLRIINISALTGVKMPWQIISGLSGAVSKIKCPSGYLKLSALSAWSLFEPMDYRLHDIDFSYNELRLFIKRKFRFRCLDITPNVNFSYIKVLFEGSCSHKEIFVLLPVYVGEEQINISDLRIFLLSPSLTITLHAGRADISISGLQRVPFVLKTTQTDKDSSSDHKSALFTGGTSLSASVKWDIGKHYKQ